jgi:uncharacterized protein
MKISEINIYPIKSLRGIALENAFVEERGLKDDRRLMLVDENGNLLTQREFPKMATVAVDLKENGLEVSAEGFETLSMADAFADAETVTVRVWQSFCDALVAKPSINEWFADVLRTNCRLVRMPDSTRRRINEMFNRGDEIVSFADGYPLLLIGESSLAELNERLANKLPMNRFRPNLVVSGTEAFAEDGWERIKIGETVFRITKPCARCVITTIDQATGIPDLKEPLKTLAAFRQAAQVFPEKFTDFGHNKTDILFGQNLVAENFGSPIKVGDRLEVL